MLGTETIGAYKVTPMKDGKYAVTLTNGDKGAFVTDKKGLEEFKAKYNKKEDTAEINGKKKSSKAKKIGKGIASAFIPGLGQVIDGRWKDGFKDWGKQAGLLVAGSAIGIAGYLDFVKRTQAGRTPFGMYAALAGSVAIAAGLIVNKVHSAVDAYKKG